MQEAVLSLLLERDAQNAVMARFCGDYQQSVGEQMKLRGQLSQVLRERAVLEGEKEALLRKIGAGSVQSSAEMDAKVRELEDKVHQLQSQLTEAYRNNSINVEKMLAAVSGVQEKEAEAARLRERSTELAAAVERLTRDLNEREVSLAAIRDEVHAVQARLVEKEAKLRDTEQENAVLIERWLNYKNEEVERLNQANIYDKERKAREQEKQAALQAEGKAIMQNKAKVGMLDAAGGAEGSYVSVRLPTMARREFVAHQGEANCVSYSTSGNRFCTGGADMRIKIWDSRTGAVAGQLSGSVGSVMSATWSMNEQFILGAACDNVARVWDVQLGRIKHTFTGHIGKVYSGVFTSDASKVITGAHDRTVKVWDMATGNTIRTIFCFSSCNDVCLSESYACIASAHLDGALRLWDMRSGEATYEFKDAHTKQISSVAVAPNESSLLSAARDNLIKIWDFRMNRCLSTLKDDAYRSGLNWSRACWSPDSKYVAAGGAEGSLFIWDVEKGTLCKQLGSESNATISGVAWSPTGTQLVTTDRKSKCVIWE